jgi:hypothetical protein
MNLIFETPSCAVDKDMHGREGFLTIPSRIREDYWDKIFGVFAGKKLAGIC